jgi:NADH oxidase (H2O2-forming)
MKDMGKNVTIIEMMNQVIPRIADKDMADVIQNDLESMGIKFIMGAPIQSVNGDGAVKSVTAAGVEYPCDVMIFATGIRANLDLPKALGFDVGQLGALVVAPTLNPYRRGRLVPDIYVAGDLVQCESAIMPGPTMSQLGSTAVKQGIIAGNNASGAPKKLFGPVASPWVSVIGERQIAGTGLSLGLASWYGIDVVVGKAKGLNRARYYPGGKELVIKVLADKTSHRIIGGQIIAGEEATGRIDWITAAAINGMTAEDFLVRSETAYCPPTSMVKDVVISAVEDLCRNLAK